MFLLFPPSAFPLMDPTLECLYLVLVIQLPDCGTLVWQAEQCGHFMGTGGMLILSNSFLMEIDLELAQMMELADCLTLGPATNYKYIISNMVTMKLHM